MIVQKTLKTLGLIKPDLYLNKHLISTILNEIQQHHFTIFKSKEILWEMKEAQLFYREHQGKFFYKRLCEYMTSGPFLALLLSKENGIQDWRQLIGPTSPFKARLTSPGSLRAKYGLSDTRNSFHGSANSQDAAKEIEFFFPELKNNLPITNKF